MLLQQLAKTTVILIVKIYRTIRKNSGRMNEQLVSACCAFDPIVFLTSSKGDSYEESDR